MHGNVANVAVVGMGQWGRNLARNLYELGALRVVCDREPDRDAVVRETCPRAGFVRDFAAVLADEAVRAVVLATPAALHYEMAEAAIEARKDVFVEKPLALDVDEGRRLVERAESGQRVLMVGHVLRYHPAVVKLGELIRDGELGRLQYLYSNRLNIGRIRTEENILWSFAPHDISIMLALLGEEPSSITCQGGAYLDQRVPDVTLSQFVFPSGVHAHIFVNWLHPFKEQRLVVVGTERMAVFDDTTEDKLVLYPHRVEWKNRVPTAVRAEGVKVPLPKDEPLRAECTHFLECVASRRPPVTDGREGLRVLKVLHACQQALESGRIGDTAPAAQTGRRRSVASSDPHYFAHETACVDAGSEIGAGTKIWHFSHVMKGARIGERCTIGQNCYVDGGAVIGRNVRIQNNVSVYAGVVIEDDVFLGPSCVLTNVSNPRSQINRHALFEKTLLRRGATVGANATIRCGVELGRYAFVAAGAVVSAGVPDYALVMGVPARQVGWMSRHGHRLPPPNAEGVRVCPESGYRYRETAAGTLRCLDLDEDAPLPQDQAVGARSHAAFKLSDHSKRVQQARTSCGYGVMEPG